MDRRRSAKGTLSMPHARTRFDLVTIRKAHLRALEYHQGAATGPEWDARPGSPLLGLPRLAVLLAVQTQLFEQVTWLAEGAGEPLPDNVVFAARHAVLDLASQLVIGLDRAIGALVHGDGREMALWAVHAAGQTEQALHRTAFVASPQNAAAVGLTYGAKLAESLGAAIMASGTDAEAAATHGSFALAHVLTIWCTTEGALPREPPPLGL
jgi:hypothetical protein